MLKVPSSRCLVEKGSVKLGTTSFVWLVEEKIGEKVTSIVHGVWKGGSEFTLTSSNMGVRLHPYDRISLTSITC